MTLHNIEYNTDSLYNMKRYIFISLFFLVFFVCSAQLSKFQGTWIGHYTTKGWTTNHGATTLSYIHYLRFDLVDGKLYIREKEVDEDDKKTEYFDIEDIEIINDSLIIYKRYYDYNVIKFYWEKLTPHSKMSYNDVKQYRIITVSHFGAYLSISSGNTFLQFYNGSELVDTDKYETSSVLKLYREEDNW